ncbi:MAG: GAF domain-containing protein [bacterium P3]|nr:MAG: GAF domain-containing protein [bacterium P3]KWW40421.1 MAG: GAF domain-containing protein [bacterium F083]
MRKQINVVAAIIHDGEGRVFATQRGYGEWKDYWEFPGGKIEPGECAEEALRREIWEELETRIVIERLEATVEYDYPKFHLTMRCYLCRIESGSLTLKEHEAARWLSMRELESVGWLPADWGLVKTLKDTMNKEERYRLLTKQIRALTDGETDAVAVMANVCAAIHGAMGFFWTGFYRVKEGALLLGPFQGPVACTHIGFGCGVCGTAWERRETMVVPDVEQFPGHIACSSQSRSEIVVPVFSREGEVVAVLDIDSKERSTFDDIDRRYLEEICRMVKL